MFTAQQTIDIWERGERLHPIDRGLLLLSEGWPDIAWEQLAELPIGRRDAALMELRRSVFGDRIEGYARCPSCDQEVEFPLSLQELLATVPDDSDLRMEFPDGSHHAFRLPDSSDLAAIVERGDPENMRERLAERCLLTDPEKGESPVLNDEMIEALSLAMQKADPLADVRVDLVCPDCGDEWEVVFDILTWFWEELSRAARALLGEVHLLASRYGWSEEAILGMSARRRKHYIDLIL